VSLLFDLIDEGTTTDIAANKDKMIGEAVSREYLRRVAARKTSFEVMQSGASATFKVFHQAILERKQITCRYEGAYREICPHILGHTDGVEKALVFQFAGESTTKLPPNGQWKCLFLSKMRDAKIREGRWHTGSQHRKGQTCVKDVYVDVNTAVPNQPGRR
jgi:uncharacterized protein